MSKLTTVVAAIAFAAGLFFIAPGSAQAGYWGWHGGFGWGPYLYYGWPYQSYSSFYIPRPHYYAPTYYAPAYYEPPPRCEWVSVRGWHHGHRVWREVRRCW
jgi:hypothetical protein